LLVLLIFVFTSFTGIATALRRAGIRVDIVDEDRARATVSRLEDALPVDIVIEAIFENASAKRALFARLETLVPSTTTLASNTSSLDIDAMGTRVIGMHFFAPAGMC